MKSNKFEIKCLLSQLSEIIVNVELDDSQKIQVIKMILEC